MKKTMTSEARAYNEGRSWARREWRATVSKKRGKWHGNGPTARALAIAVSPETERLALLVNAAAAEEWERLHREAQI